MKKYPIPRLLFNKLKDNAPTITISEDYGRGQEYFGDYDEDASGYKAVMIYIQLGLSEYEDLIKEVVNLILKVQGCYSKHYPLVVAAFGKGKEFIHDRKYFEMGFMNDWMANTKISKVLVDLCKKEKSDIPAIIPDFFPKTDMRSLYDGKMKFETGDLMVIIGKIDEVFFSSELQNRFKAWMKKSILFVEIDGENVNWKFKNYEILFSDDSKAKS